MTELVQIVAAMRDAGVAKWIVSNPQNKSTLYKKIIAERKAGTFQIACYTDKQVFHENVTADALPDRLGALTWGNFKQINGFAENEEHVVLLSKKGACRHTVKKQSTAVKQNDAHNRQKNYLLAEGQNVPPLVDMGVFTKDGKVVQAMYRKYKQINRFLEIIDDEISKRNDTKLNVIDFGCGKSYLTFVLYHYLTEIKHIETTVIGLDLKADVIEKCNAAAQKYGYDGLHFELGDINGYQAPFDVNMVVTLHACDTATDFALYNAIGWGADMIFSVPCCQHELNDQQKPQNLSILSRYGIVQERFAALATDAIRANLLEYCGYKTQLLEFIDLDHTPKNILIRATKRPITPKAVRVTALREVQTLINEFSFDPTLYKLIVPED